MKHHPATAAAAALIALSLALGAFAAPSPTRPLVPLLDADAIRKACDGGLARVARDIRAMEARRGGDIFLEWNRLQVAIEDVLNPVYLLGSVHPDKAVRDAAEPCLAKFTTLNTELLQNEKLFRRVKAARAATPHQAKLKKDLVEAFEDSGVALPAAKRERAKAIFDRLEELRQAFDRRVRDDPTRVVVKPAEMEGLPASYLKAHEAALDKDGNYVLTLKYPSYVPFLANAVSGEARQRYWIAKQREGGEENLKTLEELYALRQELAGLYGLPTYADYVLRRKMAGTPGAVEKFLAEVRAAVAPLERSELEELRAAKAKHLGQPLEAVKLARWDTQFYTERLKRERYSIDQEQLRRYFPTGKAIDFTLLVSQRLYGVKFREAKVPAWHEDVRYFDVLDAKTGKFISGFYLDLFPREGKFNHAAAFPVRGASLVARRTPLSVLVTNFNREGLDHGEMETLLHEFGHVLHGVLSRTDYVVHGGTSTKQDFVEAPSQMFEEWVRRPQPLALMKEVCPQCPQLTADEIARLESSRRFGQGLRYAFQWQLAAFDMALSTKPQPPLPLWKAFDEQSPQGFVEGTLRPAGIGHLASGYAAGYYGYMWSEVLALDMLSAYGGDLLDPKVGRRYRDEILSQGGQREEAEDVRRFLGRAPSSEAFFREITGKR